MKNQLCQTCVSYLLRRASTRKEPFDIYMGPKRLASVTAQSVLQLTGSIWPGRGWGTAHQSSL